MSTNYVRMVPPPTETSQVTDATNDNTTSGTDNLLASMTLTPLPGTYLVLFNSSITCNAAGMVVSTSIYVGGTQDGGSLTKIAPFDGGALSATTARGIASCIGTATVNGSQAIEIRWSTSAGTATCGPRRMILLRVL